MFDLVQREERMRNGGIPEQRGQTTDYRALQLSDLMKNLCIKMHRIDIYLCMNFQKSLFLVTLLIFSGAMVCVIAAYSLAPHHNSVVIRRPRGHQDTHLLIMNIL